MKKIIKLSGNSQNLDELLAVLKDVAPEWGVTVVETQPRREDETPKRRSSNQATA